MQRLVAAVVVSLVVIGIFAAGAVSAPQRVRAPQTAQTASVPLAKVAPQLRALTSQRGGGFVKRCRTVKCVNRKVNKVIKSLSFFFSCTDLSGVSQFSGYALSGGGSTTAIDFDTLSVADEAHIIWTCSR